MRAQALKLARTLAPEQVGYISREFAQQLEFNTEYEEALSMYQKGLADGATGHTYSHTHTYTHAHTHSYAYTYAYAYAYAHA